MPRQNGITVEDLLNLKIMNNCNLIAGFKSIRNTISRVNIMADPDIPDWIQEGEFLLTTAYFFERDGVETQKNLINACVKHNLAGIGIKLSPYVDELSQEVLDLANELNLPIVDIHHSIPLADVMTIAFQEIFNKQASLLKRIEHIHEQLMNATLEGTGLEAIVQIVQNNVKNPVVLSIDGSNEMIEDLGQSVHLRDELLEDVHDFKEHQNKRNKLKRLDEDKILINGTYVNRMIMPIVLRDNLYGHIFTWATSMPLGGFDLAILESASTTIALNILQELSVKEVEIRYRTEFFDDLVSADDGRKQKSLNKAKIYNLNQDDYYAVEVIRFRQEHKSHEMDVESEPMLMDIINSMFTSIEELIRYHKLSGIISTRVNGIQILLGNNDTELLKEKINDFNLDLMKLVDNKNDDLDIKIGVGRIYEGLIEARRSFVDAVRAVRIGRKVTDNKIIRFRELGVFKILSQSHLDEELEDFYNTTLKPLVDYDKKKSTELVRTLEVFFKNNGNLTKISKELYAHYNTVLYRINRINEICNMDLNNPEDQLNLQIALKINELLAE